MTEKYRFTIYDPVLIEKLQFEAERRGVGLRGLIISILKKDLGLDEEERDTVASDVDTHSRLSELFGDIDDSLWE